MTTRDPLVLSERRDAVLLLTLNRPDRLNAWTDELEDEYFGLLAQADEDRAVRSVVVTGAGRGFCAGADMELLRAIEPGSPLRDRTLPYRVTKPLIAAVNGAAAGIGLVQALFCDVRFTVPEAKWTTAFAQRGLVAEYGAAWLLGRMVGPGQAADLLMSARVVLGREAVGIGLADRLAPAGEVVDEAVAYADTLARASSPWSMAVMKRQLHEALDGTFEEAVATSDARMSESFARGDVAEGVASFVERREPAFEPVTGADL